MIAVLLADGFEEIEALTPVDMLRRAGLDVKTVAAGSKTAVGSHGISVICDMLASEVNENEISMLILPGGMPGSLNLDASPFTDKFINAVLKNGGRLAAICAAPLILGRRGLLSGKEAICYPGFEEELRGAKISTKSVITDGNITTAKGMGAALAFAEELLTLLVGKEKADELAAAVMKEKEAGAEKINTSVSKCFESGDTDGAATELEIEENIKMLTDILEKHNVRAAVRNVDRGGPRITRYEIVPARGVRVNSVISLFEDIALNLAAEGIRMEAPIPGKSAIGVEIPNKHPSVVMLSDLLETEEFKNESSKTFSCIGKDITGSPVFADIAKMPHILVAGATGMGKSVCINSILTSILSKARPDEVKFIMIDPKMVEFTMYNGIPHMLVPVITNLKQAAGALMWAVDEMNRRYELMSKLEAGKLDSYNELVRADPSLGEPLPKIIIVIDELNDLMQQVRKPAEGLIAALAQKASAAGIHMIIGTQRPKDDVITRLIKKNIPARIAFKVTSFNDSRTIIEMSGAERLLNNGDMLYFPADKPKPIRVQGTFVSDAEVERITKLLKSNAESSVYDSRVTEEIRSAVSKCFESGDTGSASESASEYLSDGRFISAVELAIQNGKLSTSLIQRKIGVGYGKAAEFIDIMEELGIVSEPNGQKPRDVLITADEWKRMLSETGLDG